MKKIILTGGGTAGHVTPNIALLPSLREAGFEIAYIGSKDGIEKQLIEAEGIPYTGISTGKLRRYFSLRNFTDPIRVQAGYTEAKAYLRDYRPDIVFSKGGFVAVPVVSAAHSLRIPVITHESDITPGLANRLMIRYAEKICCSFPETLGALPAKKAVFTGCPIRQGLLTGSREAGLSFTGLSGEKPVLLVVGGSLGAAAVNEAVRGALPSLLADFEIVHLCGKEKTDPSLDGTPGYRQYEYISEEMADLFALSDVVISRAGANAIREIAALAKPNLLIPLSAKASRGDQILNAASFKRQGFSSVLLEEDATPEAVAEAVRALYADREKYVEAMRSAGQGDAVAKIVELIKETAL